MDPLHISIWQQPPQTRQPHTQEETDRAVQEILDEDSDLDANYPMNEYLEFEKQQKLNAAHSQSMPPKSIHMEKKSNVEEDRRYSEMRKKVMELRRKEFERWEDDMERRRKHAVRLQTFKIQERNEERVMNGWRKDKKEGNVNELEHDWHLYCKKVRNEARTEKELQRHRKKELRTARWLEKRERLRKEANGKMVIEKVVYCSNKYVIPHAKSPRSDTHSTPIPITKTPCQNLETPNTVSTLKEQTFEDIVLSSSEEEEENDQENVPPPQNKTMLTPHPSSYRQKCIRRESSPFRQLRNLNL